MHPAGEAFVRFAALGAVAFVVLIAVIYFF